MKTEQYAYRLAPWRKQLQNILNILMGLVFAACVALVYLYYSAQLTDMKLQIQFLHNERNDLTRTIADYLTREGILNSFTEMEKRAAQAGYVKIDFYNEDIYDYVLLPGYTGSNLNGLLRVPQQQVLPVSPLKPEFQESLRQWLISELPLKRSAQ